MALNVSPASRCGSAYAGRSAINAMSCCQICGHRVTFSLNLESSDDETKVQPRVQAGSRSLVTKRGGSIAHAARDLDLYQTVLGRWVRDYDQSAQDAFPGHEKLTVQDEEIRRLRRENARLKAERGILKMAAAYFAKDQA